MGDDANNIIADAVCAEDIERRIEVVGELQGAVVLHSRSGRSPIASPRPSNR